MRISTEIRNRRMMGFLLKGETPKEVARRFNLSVWVVYKAQEGVAGRSPNKKCRFSLKPSLQ
jgi:transposase